MKQYQRPINHGSRLPVERQSLAADNVAIGEGPTEGRSLPPSGTAVDLAAVNLAAASASPECSFGWQLAPAGVVLMAAFAWAYWPTLVNLVAAWNREPDYSHGFLVVPAAIYFLWVRRDRFPGMSAGLSWLGLGLIVLSLCTRVLSAHYYLEAIDGWSIMLWVAGVVWLFAGWRVMWWSLPSIIFLWFMVPLPFRVERFLSLPLQGAATKLSCWALQFLGQPALAEAHVIVLGGNRLEVEQACSGLRIFVGILALAFVYVVVVRRTWWEKGLLLASAIPIALIANASRIVATGMLYQYVSGEAGKEFAHDAAGWVMILFAAGLFGIVLWYSSVLVREVELVEVGAVVSRERG